MKEKAIAVEGQTKVCPKCKRELSIEEYNKGNGMFGRRSICRDCEHQVQNTPERVARRRELELLRRQNPDYVKHRNEMDRLRRHNDSMSLRKELLRAAKQRALQKGLDFDITIDDIVLPENCPLLGIKLQTHDYKASGNSYSIDRIDSSKGYIKGNVWVISKRANTLKNNATLEELKTLVTNLERFMEDFNEKLVGICD